MRARILRSIARILGRLALVVGTIVAMLFVFRDYYGPDGLLFGDFNPQWSDDLLSAALNQLRDSWNPNFGGGMSSIIMNATTFAPLALQAALRPAGIPLSTELMYPAIFAFAYLGCFFLLRHLGTAPLASMLVSLLYVGNPWILDRVLLGHSAILIAVAIVPWLFSACSQSRAPHTFGLLTVMAAAAELQADVRIAYLSFVGLYLLAFTRLSFTVMRGGLQSLATAIRQPSILHTFAAPFLAFLLDGWWTLPFLLYKDINPVRPFYPPLEEVATYSSQGDIARDFVMSGNFLHYSWTTVYGFGVIAFIAWYAAFVILTAIALYAPALPPTRRAMVRLAVIAGLLLSTGTKYFPAQAVYWFYLHVPFAAFFRDPNKFSFVVSLGLVIGVASAWVKLNRFFRFLAGAAICLICLPLFSGHFQVRLDPQYESFADPGMQRFTERSHFVKLLRYLRSQPDFPNFRIAVIPPWLSEQSLRSGSWYVTNPFVFQLEVPTIDAKLVSTGTPTTEAAWRAFNALYWGLDQHPGSTFSRLGVRYFIVLDNAVVSLGAGPSPYFGVAVGRVKAALSRDGAIHEVFRDGPYHIYKNESFHSIIRTAALPLVGDGLSDEVRTALPAGELGDSLSAPDGRQLPMLPGTVGVGQTPLDRCLSTDTRSIKYSAYQHVSQMENWFAFWTASDYPQNGSGDPVLDRQLQRYSEPFALTLSLHELAIPIVAPSRSHVFVEAAGVADDTLLESSIDGKQQDTWKPSSLGFSWHDVGVVEPGRHELVLVGSTIGTAVKAIVLASRTCGSSGITIGTATHQKGRVFFIPGPEVVANLSHDASHWKLRALGTPIRINGRSLLVNGAASAGALPAGVSAFTWDDKPIREDVPFLTLSGIHTLRGFRFSGLDDATTPRRLGQAFVSDVGGARPGTLMAIRIRTPYRRVFRAVAVEGGRANILTIANKNTDTFLFEPLTSRFEIYVYGLPLSPGRVPVEIHAYPVLEQLRSNVLLAAAAIRLPDDSVATIEPNFGRPIDLTFKRDHMSLETNNRFRATYVEDNTGHFSHLRLRGVHSPVTQRAVVTVYYRTLSGDVAERPVAEFVVTPRPKDVLLSIAAQPYMTALAIAIRQPNGQSTMLSSQSMELTAGARVNAGYFLSVPSRIERREAVTVTAAPEGQDRISFLTRRHVPIVANFSFDEHWFAPNADHYVANGTSNLWAGRGPIYASYSIQALYLRLLEICSASWILLILAIIVLLATSAHRRSA